MKFLTHPLTAAAFPGFALLLVIFSGCNSPSQAKFAGVVAAVAIKKNAPTAAPYVETVAASIRSVAGVTAPTPATVQSTATQWVAKLPISDAEKARVVSAVVTKYTERYPALKTSENALDDLEAFVSGLETGGL